MRIFILALLLASVANNSFSQNCDIAQNGVKVYNDANAVQITSVGKGQTAYFKFSLKNLGVSLNCTIPSNSITAVFDFPTLGNGVKPYKYDGPATFVSGYFTWTYNADAEVLVGVNTTIIPGGEGDADISVKVKATGYGTGNSNLNITQGKGVSDNASNNFATAKLLIPKPVTIKDLSATADRCNIVLKWKTSSETAFSRFEIEYSIDGITFINAGRVEGRNISTGADYRYAYSQSAGEGYYRLKQVAIDGSYEYSEVMHVNTDCNGKPTVSIFPNPIDYSQKLVVNISGFSGKISGELFNAAGQRVGVYSFGNMANEVSVKDLSAGSYMLYVRDEAKEVQAFKVVVTR